MVGGAEHSGAELSLAGRRQEWKKLFRRYLFVDLGLIGFCAFVAYGVGMLAVPLVEMHSLPFLLAACATVSLGFAWTLKLFRDYPR